MNKEKIIRSLYFKHYLLYMYEDELIEEFAKKYNKPLETFIKMYEATLELDPYFFYYFIPSPEIIRNIISLYKKQNNNLDDIILFKTNQIVMDMNQIDALSKDLKKDLEETYKKTEEEERKIKIIDRDFLLEIICRDIKIYEEIEMGLLPGEYISTEDYDPGNQYCFQYSLNKFKKSFPELLEDENFCNNAKKLKKAYELKNKEESKTKNNSGY